MQIIPAIDVLDGKCVRLTQGDYSRVTEYGDDPSKLGDQFLEAGAAWVHLVDLSAAKAGVSSAGPVVESLSKKGLKVETGGGIRSLDSAKAMLNAGASRVIAGTALVKDPDFRAEFFRLSEAAAGLDAVNGEIMVSGWTQGSNLQVKDFAMQIAREGCRLAILTDISRDGMLTGPNLELLSEVLSLDCLDIIHSGGIGSLDDAAKICEFGLSHPQGSRLIGMITGKALYEGMLDLHQAIELAKRMEKVRSNP